MHELSLNEGTLGGDILEIETMSSSFLHLEVQAYRRHSISMDG
jgi:hypothetical protein